jgi:hypothetical protein
MPQDEPVRLAVQVMGGASFRHPFKLARCWSIRGCAPCLTKQHPRKLKTACFTLSIILHYARGLGLSLNASARHVKLVPLLSPQKNFFPVLRHSRLPRRPRVWCWLPGGAGRWCSLALTPRLRLPVKKVA